jgi:hypothetical protein
MFSPPHRIITHANWSHRYGATLVPTWFSYVFTYAGDNRSLQGFLDAIVLVMETGFAVTAVVALILNLSLPYDVEDDSEVIPETDGQVATFTSEADVENISKGVPDIGEKKVDELEA